MANSISRTFFFRKLHQLTGIIPLGIFFCIHMLTNAKAMNGAAVFNSAVEDIHHLPFLFLIEVFGIFLPLLYHSVYGLLISSEARVNLNYKYERNWFYIFQRVTGIVLFFFLLIHLLHFRWGLFGTFGLTNVAVAGNAGIAYNIVAGDFAKWWVLIFYIIGIAATAWHFGYGLFLFVVDWGLVVGEKAQQYMIYASVAVALTLFAVGTNAAFSFVRPCGLMPQFMCDQKVEKVNETRKF